MPLRVAIACTCLVLCGMVGMTVWWFGLRGAPAEPGAALPLPTATEDRPVQALPQAAPTAAPVVAAAPANPPASAAPPTPDGVLEGVVVDGSDQPLAGASVYICPDVEGARPWTDPKSPLFDLDRLAASGWLALRATTDAAGGFRRTLAANAPRHGATA